MGVIGGGDYFWKGDLSIHKLKQNWLRYCQWGLALTKLFTTRGD